MTEGAFRQCLESAARLMNEAEAARKHRSVLVDAVRNALAGKGELGVHERVLLAVADRVAEEASR